MGEDGGQLLVEVVGEGERADCLAVGVRGEGQNGADVGFVGAGCLD